MFNSLRTRLALWLLLPLTVLVLVCSILSKRDANNVADYVQDHDLLSSAKILSERLIWEDGNVHATVPPSALSLFMSPAHDQIYLSVTDTDGNLLAGQADFPQPAQLQLAGADAAQWYDATWQGQPIRAVVTSRAMYDVAGSRQFMIMVGKTTHSRDTMVRTLWLPTLEYLLWALGIAMVVSVTALTLELRPLLRMSRQLAERPAKDMDFHIDARALQQELRPLADTVNQFARTIRAQIKRQREFISDAAHQLRTPLAIQAHTLAQTPKQIEGMNSDQQAALWTRLQRSNQQLVNVTNQLLMLAQAEQSEAHSHAVTPVDLEALCLQALERFAPVADQKTIDLGWHGERDEPDASFVIQTASPLITELINNLLDNALRYTPASGQVTLGLRAKADGVTLYVEDNGPGIPAQSRDKVFDRFYRIATDTQGTGLGLAIVQEVADACHAEIRLSDAVQGSASPSERPGLRVEIHFPRQ
ncbi:sensor histidine kinase [Diaphorobacter sp. HDW4B]|uniref:sensor histidine kinase n=1 Tax=Diaphorobacter sp. HDW4B TaxID=2714925 RepID=UPI00140B1036|nr:sensor histidine kinase [Diaphorobacter sp. HDW4B]QIL72412.1 sensor histidine kinase [Diaphorobacter sp. HDW4B]